ncbi:MAG: autotransporter-associated beta strand repeat-containing protein, partial [Planctomycetota bacterium]
MRSRSIKLNMVLAAGLAALLCSGGALAATCTWSGGGGNALWSTPANWDVVPVDGDDLVFPSGAAGFTAQNDSLITVHTISFGGAAGGANYTLNGNQLTISIAAANGIFDACTVAGHINTISFGGTGVTVGGAGQVWKVNTAGTTLNVTCPVVNNAGQLLINNGGSGDVVISGAISGTGSVYHIWNTLTLSGNNSFSGGVTEQSGTLNINSATALGTGTFTIVGGTIDNTNGGVILTTNNPQKWNSNLTFTGTNSLDLGAGAVTPNASRIVTVSASTLTVGGAIGGGAINLTKAGGGTLVLTGANTYSGTTTISAGTLNANASAALGDESGTNTLIFTGGTLQAAAAIVSPGTRTVTLTSTGLIDTNT